MRVWTASSPTTPPRCASCCCGADNGPPRRTPTTTKPGEVNLRMSTAPPSDRADNTPSPDPAQRRREQRGWYVYDWANQVFITSVVTVLIGPYLSGLACEAAGTP